jgi:general secretion pathway protein L
VKALARTTPEAAEPTGLLDWWLGELRDLLPGRRPGRGRRRAGLQLRLERPFIRVLGRRGQRLEPLGSFLLPDGPEREPAGVPAAWGEPELRRALDRHKDSLVLVLGPDDSLVCTDQLPASAESELARIVAHKVDLLTPWPAEQVYAAHRVAARRADGMLEILLAVAPRKTVDEVRGRLARLGIVPAALDLAGEDGRTVGVDLLHADAPAPRSALVQAALALLLVAALAAAGWAGVQIWQRERQLAAQRQLTAGLEERLADLPALRERLSALQNEASFLANDRRSRPSPLIVLEVLSRLLPDTVWLSEVRLDERGLVIAGMAEDSSALIPLIESAPEFAEVRFQTPSTRVRVRIADGGEREVERFAIGATVDPSVEPSL